MPASIGWGIWKNKIVNKSQLTIVCKICTVTSKNFTDEVVLITTKYIWSLRICFSCQESTIYYIEWKDRRMWCFQPSLLWYKAMHLFRCLPEGFKNSPLRKITEKMGISLANLQGRWWNWLEITSEFHQNVKLLKNNIEYHLILMILSLYINFPGSQEKNPKIHFEFEVINQKFL